MKLLKSARRDVTLMLDQVSVLCQHMTLIVCASKNQTQVRGKKEINTESRPRRTMPGV
jgi:hypothetical protein